MKIVKFSSQEAGDASAVESFGARGERIAELSRLKANIVPCFIVDSEKLYDITQKKDVVMIEELRPNISHIEKALSRSFSGNGTPLLVKVIESSMLNVVQSKINVHNLGLCDTTVGYFADQVGEKFAWAEYCNMVQRILQLELTLEKNKQRKKWLEDIVIVLKKAKNPTACKAAIDSAKRILPAKFFSAPFAQLAYLIRLANRVIQSDETSTDSCLLVQAVVFGNLGKNSGYGNIFTRDIITGKAELSGGYFPNSFDQRGDYKPIKALATMYAKHHKVLQALATRLEEHFKQARQIIFTIEHGILWIIDQRAVPGITAQAELKTLLDLSARKIVDKNYIVREFGIDRVSDLLHPALDPASVATFNKFTGGISGAVGSAIGRVFFTTEALVEAHRRATLHGEDVNFILAMTSTFAEDVKAIEVGNGVITSEGGYASHAPVVARSLGKVAMLNPNITFSGNTMKIGDLVIKQGDYITLDVSYSGAPSIYAGKGSLMKQNPEKNGLVELMAITDSYTTGIHVRANADQPVDAKVARGFGAKGIGLCRTEHMFFNKDRINLFRAMIISATVKERKDVLKKLEALQMKDFLGLFKAMDGYPVTIRLLDAPLHEFLPHSQSSMKEFIDYYRKLNPKITADVIRYRCDLLREFNPMLGHRGVRLAFTYPEIYRMQLRAIFKATYKIKAERGKTLPEILIPMVMLPTELKAIRNGKNIEGKSIASVQEIENEVRKEIRAKGSIEYLVGTMIELPAAALRADQMARYADFFCFGTNDLTQTTIGLSRDDFTGFAADYSEYDLMSNNPFQVLGTSTQELISIAIERGRLTRPGMEIGLCGEHGADPANIPFILSAGLDYVSCSPYGIPIAKMAIAKKQVSQE